MPIISPGIPVAVRSFCGPFWREGTVAPSQSNNAMLGQNVSSTYRFVFPMAGKVTGVIRTADAAISAGTLTVLIKKNDTTADSSIALTSGQQSANMLTTPVSFAIGDELDMRWDSDASLAGISHFALIPIITFD